MTPSLDRLRNQAANILAEVGEADNKNVFDQTQNLIDMIRYSLAFPKKQLGVWETMELNAANSALASGFFKLAITFACRAIEVSGLPEIEYLFGFEAVRHHHGDPVKVASDAWGAKASLRQYDARDLLWLQNTTAINLLQVQVSQAKDLRFQQKIAAESLMIVQKGAAENLVRQDFDAAKELVVEQKSKPDRLTPFVSADETVVKKEDIQMFMRWGDYSVEGKAKSRGVDTKSLVRKEREIASDLKESQRLRAVALEQAQKYAAAELVNNETAGSKRLKSVQKTEAAILSETNALKALLKKKEEGAQDENDERHQGGKTRH